MKVLVALYFIITMGLSTYAYYLIFHTELLEIINNLIITFNKIGIK
jgi:hypothetical protein